MEMRQWGENRCIECWLKASAVVRDSAGFKVLGEYGKEVVSPQYHGAVKFCWT